MVCRLGFYRARCEACRMRCAVLKANWRKPSAPKATSLVNLDERLASEVRVLAKVAAVKSEKPIVIDISALHSLAPRH